MSPTSLWATRSGERVQMHAEVVPVDLDVSDEFVEHWMAEHLRLAVWPAPPGIELNDVETAVLQELKPPLNLSKVTSPWKPTINSARRRMVEGLRARRPAPLG
jgi:hypothetical protein